MRPTTVATTRAGPVRTLTRGGTRELSFVLAHHRNLMLGISAAVVAYSLTTDALSPGIQLVLLAAAVICVGLPHGALDHLIGRALLSARFGSRWWLPFALGYVGAGATVAALWIFAPLASLVVFLLFSAAHFGWDDPMWLPTTSGWTAALERYAVGALPILLPILAHPGEVTVIFSWLMPSGVALEPTAVAAAGWLVAAALLPTLAVRSLRLFRGGASAHASAAEMSALVVLHVACSPLIAFLTYFCGWHSMRHALELAEQLAPGRPSLGLRLFGRAALPLTATTVVAAIVAAPLLGAFKAQPSEVLATLVFVGLSVLTVPHMGMMAMARRTVRDGRPRVGRSRLPLTLSD